MQFALLAASAALAAGHLANISVSDICDSVHSLDCYGDDLPNGNIGKVTTHEECCQACQQRSGCSAWTWAWNYDGTCYLKSGCSDKRTSDDGYHSGTGAPSPAPSPPGPSFAHISGVYSSSDLKALLAPVNIPAVPYSEEDEVTIRINTAVKRQEIIGFGGAFTEAASLGFASLKQADQQQLIDAYFAPPEEGGNGYTVGRVHINSCDFSVASYSFDEVDGDYDLVHFDMNVTHDQQAMLPMMRSAMARAPEGIKIFASPWSPPSWMKTNGKMTDGGNLKPEASAAWALYFSKFFTAYKNNGIALWGLTVQNEPHFQQGWESCVYTAAATRDFVKNNLGPVMRRDHPEAKIMVLDDNREIVPQWAQTIFSDADAAKYVDGMGLHWYDSRSSAMYNNVKEANDQYLGKMGKFILATEACNCPGVSLKDWGRAWSIASDILEDLNVYVTGWTDWNLVVDHRGGPNHLGNYCDANIVADPEEILGSGTVIKQVSYYLMGHFSRYLRPGMVHVESSAPNGLQVTAFQDERTAKVAVVIMNAGSTGVNFAFQDLATNTSKAGLYIAPSSIYTYTYQAVARAGVIV